jgi:hypothetical protein
MSHGIERVDQRGGVSWWHNIVQPVRPHRNILHIDRDDSPATILHLDGHGVAVQENGDIMGSVQKTDPREARVQVGEDVYSRSCNVAEGTDYLDGWLEARR